MEIRKYKWEDLELLREFFETPDSEIARNIGCTEPIITMARNGKVDREKWSQRIGMAWEIFAIYYVLGYPVTRALDPHNAYNVLVYYCKDMINVKKSKRIRFDVWYCEED